MSYYPFPLPLLHNLPLFQLGSLLPFDTVVITYQNTWFQNPEDDSMAKHFNKNANALLQIFKHSMAETMAAQS
jgi:hypothetical protein